jgi:enoyl-CoA hydratase/carnithine racemase
VIERKVVRYEVDDRVALVTLNRPDRLNAWTARMEAEYRDALGEADRDGDVRVVVVTGAGRGFCAGADTKALDRTIEVGDYHEASGPEQVPIPHAADAPDALKQRHSFVLGLRVPVIAAINGPAAGVGLVVACFADLRFAAAGAKLTTSFGRLGIPAEFGISWLLPRLVGAASAADLLFSSRVVLAEEARELGLVNKVLPPDELLPFTLDYARRMAHEISPASLATMKRQLWLDLAGRDLAESSRDAEARMVEMMKGPDFVEGTRALSEKRPPRF